MVVVAVVAAVAVHTPVTLNWATPSVRNRSFSDVSSFDYCFNRGVMV
jgi:hypothetical protein